MVTMPWEDYSAVSGTIPPMAMNNSKTPPPAGSPTGTAEEGPWTDYAASSPQPLPQQAPTVGVGEDVGKSALSGLVKGIPNLLDVAGSAVATGVDELGQAAGVFPERNVGDVFSKYAGQHPMSQGLDTALSAVSNAVGGNDVKEYTPQTKLGEYTNLATQGIATAPLLGGATMLNAARGAAAGVGSGIGGDVGEAVGGNTGRVLGTVAGGLAGGLSPDALMAKAKTGAAVTSADLKGLANTQYQKAEQLGGMLSPQTTDTFIAEASKKLKPQTSIGAALAGDTEAGRFADALATKIGKPMSLAEAQDIDEAFTNSINKEYGLKGLSKDGKNLMDMQHEFRNTIENASPDNGGVLGGKEGFEALKEGRKLWKQSAQLRDIENIIARGELSEQPANAIRSGFKTLASNPTRLRGYDRNTQALIRQAAKNGVVGEGLRFAGSRLLSTILATGAGAAGGGIPGALVGGLGAQGVGMVARRAGQALAEGKANKVIESIAQPAQQAGTTAESLANAARTTDQLARVSAGGIAGSAANQNRTIGIKLPDQPWEMNTYAAPAAIPEMQPVAHGVIQKEEGFFPIAKPDTTGHQTVGTGFNLDQPNARSIWKRSGTQQNFDRVYDGLEPITPETDAKVFGVTSQAAGKAVSKLVPNYASLGENQKAALTSLAFQLGGKGLSKFKALEYLAQGNSKAVENSILGTKLAKQTPARARREALMLAYDMSHEEADRQLAQQGRIKPNERKYL